VDGTFLLERWGFRFCSGRVIFVENTMCIVLMSINIFTPSSCGYVRYKYVMWCVTQLTNRQIHDSFSVWNRPYTDRPKIGPLMLFANLFMCARFCISPVVYLGVGHCASPVTTTPVCYEEKIAPRLLWLYEDKNRCFLLLINLKFAL